MLWKSVIYLEEKPVTFSLEVFPPKTSEKHKVTAENAKKTVALHSDPTSVIYGAGGGTGDFMTETTAEIRNGYGVPTPAYLTYVSSLREYVTKIPSLYKEKDVENVLALRGDLSQDDTCPEDYRYVVELVRDIKERRGDTFCLDGACHPKGHVECTYKESDPDYPKEKVDAGLDFLATQLFFGNNILYDFLYHAREKGISVLVVAGIMSVTRAEQLKRSAAVSSTEVLQHFRAITDHFGERKGMIEQAGVIYTAEQIIDLIANGVGRVHVYTTNHPEIAKTILEQLSKILD